MDRKFDLLEANLEAVVQHFSLLIDVHSDDPAMTAVVARLRVALTKSSQAAARLRELRDRS